MTDMVGNSLRGRVSVSPTPAGPRTVPLGITAKKIDNRRKFNKRTVASRPGAYNKDSEYAQRSRNFFGDRFVDVKYTAIQSGGRQRFQDKVYEKLGFKLYEWQLDAAYNITLGHDVVLIAPTGGGKSLAFQSIVLGSKNSVILVITPIIGLMKDQVKSLAEMCISACCICKETMDADPNLLVRVRNGKYQIVYAFPETTAPSNSKFWSVVNNNGSVFGRNIKAVVVDEVHCAYGWGGSFRPEYSNIGALRAFFPHIPFMALSATLPKHVLHWVHSNLHLLANTVMIKRSIDRTNIFLTAAPITHAQTEYGDLDLLVRGYKNAPELIPKTMLFVDDRTMAQEIVKHLTYLLSAQQRKKEIIRAYTSIISEEAKEYYMSEFGEKNNVCILVCTDAAGMGLNIPNIERVVQWKIPAHKHFDSWWQRVGRCVRNPDIQGHAILFYEHYKCVPEDCIVRGECIKHALSKFRAPPTDNIHPFLMSLYSIDNRTIKGPDSSLIDPGLLWWISTKGCKRQSALYLLDDDFAGKKFAYSDTSRCGRCDVCISGGVNNMEPTDVVYPGQPLDISANLGSQDSQISSQSSVTIESGAATPVRNGETPKVLGIDLSISGVYGAKYSRRTKKPKALQGRTTANQTPFVMTDLKKWRLKCWKNQIAQLRLEKSYPVLPTNWPCHDQVLNKICSHANDINTVHQLENILLPDMYLQRSALSDYAEDLVETLKVSICNRPPTPPPPAPAVPSTPSRRPPTHHTLTSKRLREIYASPIPVPENPIREDASYLSPVALNALALLEVKEKRLKQRTRMRKYRAQKKQQQLAAQLNNPGASTNVPTPLRRQISNSSTDTALSDLTPRQMNQRQISFSQPIGQYLNSSFAEGWSSQICSQPFATQMSSSFDEPSASQNSSQFSIYQDDTAT